MKPVSENPGPLTGSAASPLARITVCMTMGGRADLLRTSLQSLLALQNCQESGEGATFARIIAINDFADPACDAVFRELCPDGLLLSDGKKRGHHRAVDAMYQHIQTPYVLHTEDDWTFEGPVDFAKILGFLDAQENATQFCLRGPQDFLDAARLPGIRTHHVAGLDVADLRAAHAQWYGYTFNPHVARMDVIRRILPFAQFKKERHVSRFMRQQGFFAAYDPAGACTHIGEDRSVANPQAGRQKSALRKWARRQMDAIKAAFGNAR